jgi:hypothetical protein
MFLFCPRCATLLLFEHQPESRFFCKTCPYIYKIPFKVRKHCFAQSVAAAFQRRPTPCTLASPRVLLVLAVMNLHVAPVLAICADTTIYCTLRRYLIGIILVGFESHPT